MKRRLLASVLAATMALTSFTTVSFADSADDTAVAVSDEVVSDDAADTLQSDESSSEADETDADETQDAQEASFAEGLTWTLGATKTVSTSCATVTSDADGNPTKIVMATNNSGKFSKDDEEHLYYVTEVSKNDDFTLKADMTIDALLTNSEKNQNQSSAGIIFMSNPKSSNYNDGTGANRHEKGLAIQLYCDGKETGGLATRVLDANPTNPAKPESGATLNQFVSVPTMVNGGTNLGTYNLAIEKSGKTYTFRVVAPDGTEYVDYATPSDDMFGDTLFPGFFAARDITVTFTNINFIPDTRVFTALRVTTPPAKTEYILDEPVDLSGMVVEADYTDTATGESFTKEITDYAVSGFDSSKVGNFELSVVKGNAETTVPYTVRGKKVTKVNLTSAPIKNEYYEYQLFESSGIAGEFEFEDGATEAFKTIEVKDDEGNVVKSAPNYKLYVDGREVVDGDYFTSAQAGNKKVSIGYNDITGTIDENNVRAEYGIKIYPHKLTGIKAATYPSKKEYVIGEPFEVSGLTVNGVYKDEESGKTANGYLDESLYTVTGFDSSKAGTVNIVVTYKNDTSLTDQFTLKVLKRLPFALTITQYPRTTYINDMSLEEIEQQLLERTQLSVTYNDGELDRIYDVILINNGVPLTPVTKGQTVDAVIDASAITAGTNGTYNVTVSPVSDELANKLGVTANTSFQELDTLNFDITIWDDTQHYWRRTIQGQSSGKSSWENLTTPDEYGFSSKVHLKSWNGSGKITNGGNDGIVYYYTTFDASKNFTLTGDVEIINYLPDSDDPTITKNKKRTGQDGFGIQFRDTISLNRDTSIDVPDADAENINGSMTSLGKYAQKDEYGVPVPVKNNSGQIYSDMVLAGGQVQGTYPADSAIGSSKYYFNTHSERINMYIRTGVVTSYGTDQTGVTNYGPYCLYGDKGDEDTGLFFPQTGDVYTITLSRVNGGYFEECTIKAVGEANAQFSDWVGKTFTYAWYWTDEDIETDILTNIDDTTIYAGFCAARWADVNVSNISWYDSAIETDMTYKAIEDDIKSPAITLVSSKYTSKTNYKLMLKVNNNLGGIATIKLNDKVIQDHLPMNKNATNIGVELIPDSDNKLTVIYIPDKNDTLSSYDDVVLNETIVCCSSVYSDTEDLYVAPDVPYAGYPGKVYGSTSGTGLPESPLSLDAAIGLVNFGQKIIVMDGIYYRDETVELSSANFGFRGSMKCLWADKGAHPVFDMQGGPEGLHMNGDWWWVKGLSFTNAGANNKGGGIEASDCIVDNCKFYDNGTTGFQVSGSGSYDFIDQPARNLIVYCEVYNNHDPSGNNADGFGCKLTVGNGNVFKNCVSHHNLDDGWDFYTKTVQGYIGATVLEDCISYKCTYYLNPDGTEEQYFKGSGNGFKMGGDSMYGQHYLKDCIAFQNLKAGFDSNANPSMKLRNCVGFDNNANFGLSTGLDGSRKRYNYNADGCISYYKKRWTKDGIGTLNKDTDKITLTYADGTAAVDAEGNEIMVPKFPNSAELDLLISELLETYPEATDAIMYYSSKQNHLETLMHTALTTDAKNEAIIDLIITTDNYKLISDTNYWSLGDNKCVNASGEVVTDDFFESVNVNDMVVKGRIAQNPDGSYIRNGFLVPKGEHVYKYREDGMDIPNYPEVYYVKFPDAPHQPDVNVETTTETIGTIVKPSTSSGGGGGGSVRRNKDDNNSTNVGEITDNKPGNSSSNASSGTATTPVEEGFTDIASRAWAVEAINALNDKGIVSGVTSSLFMPDNNITRADFCVMISRATGYNGLGTKEVTFPDVDTSKYYANYVAYAAEKGYVTGYDDGEFKPDNNISRQEMMVVIARLLGADGTTDTAAIADFADANDVAAWAAPYVAYLVGEGIVAGTDSGINPTSNITRAQAAVLIYNALDKIEAGTAADEA